MPLKKPSEFYDKNPNSPFDNVKEELKNAKPEKVERISEAFDSFKGNLNNLQALKDFTETFGTFKSNVEKVETLSSSVEEIRESITDLIDRKDLDDAMMAHLLFVEESIRNVQDKVKTVNSNTLLEINQGFESLSESVGKFLGEEVPAYKKLIVDSETRVDNRFGSFKESVAESFKDFGQDIYKEIATITEGIEGVNEKSLTSIKEDVKGIGEKVKALLEEELPQYQKFFAETELKVEDRISENEELVEGKLKSTKKGCKKDIEAVEENIKGIEESRANTEKGINKLFKALANDIVTLDEKITVVDIGLTSINEQVKDKDTSVNNILAEKIIKIENLVTESKQLSDIFKRDFKNREINEDRKLQEYSSTLDSFSEKIEKLEENLEGNICELQENLDTSTTKYYDDLKSNVGEFQKDLDDKLKGIKIDFVVNEKHIEGIRREFETVLEKLQVDKIEQKSKELTGKVRHLEEVLEKFDEKKVLSEGLLNIPPDVDNSDPLTPLGQKYVTFDKLAEHYRLFVNRVQQQLATFGGGGAVRLDDLEDVDVTGGLADNYIIQYSTSNSKWVAKAGNVGGAGTWASDNVGVSTFKNVGIGTTAKSDVKLFVEGDIEATGNVNVAGTITYDDVTHVDSLGLSTFRSGLEVQTGTATTALLVDGDARITGILTIGTASITIDGDNNEINVGVVTVTNSTIFIGAGVSISGTASGINSAPNVLYVAKDGNDNNNGTSIDNAFLTIKSAVGIAQSGTTVKVLSGSYEETNPIEVPAFVSVVGDDQRAVNVSGVTKTSNIFHVRKGVKLANMTFKEHLHPAAAVSFPTDEIAENVGGGKWKGPYIQNCTSDTTTGTGLYIDGDQARSLKAMNVDAFTQYNQGGIGVAVTNGGFAQLVSLFTICTNEAVTVDKGGQADIANSNCSFGSYGLVARGVSDLQYTGETSTTAAISQPNINVDVSTPTLNISNFQYDYLSGVATVTTTTNHNFQVGMGVTLSGIQMSCAYGNKTYPYRAPFIFDVDEIPSVRKFVVNVGISTVSHGYVSGGTAKIDVDRPYDGQLVYFDKLYNEVQSIAVGSGGTGYSATPTVTVDAPTGPSGETCTAFATLEGESVASITIISSGNQYVGTPNVTISAPESGSDTATATATTQPLYYTINSSTPVTAGITTLSLATNLLNEVGIGSTAFFAQGSRIVASSHTFEYVGAGNQIVTATPKRGGVTNQVNEVVTLDGGKVLYTSTDQAGNFRIGDDLQINQETGTISGRSFSKSLFSEMTPFILALS